MGSVKKPKNKLPEKEDTDDEPNADEENIVDDIKVDAPPIINDLTDMQ